MERGEEEERQKKRELETARDNHIHRDREWGIHAGRQRETGERRERDIERENKASFTISV